MIILGNKVDKQNREVTEEEGINYIKSKGFQIFETSAISIKNVNEAFDEMINKILITQDIKSLASNEKKIDIRKDKSKKR